MTRRLVLGDGTIAHAVIGNAERDRDRVSVVTADSGWASTLREESVPAREGDPTDPSTFPDAADVILVATERADCGVRIARAAREAFPDATIVASVDVDSGPEPDSDRDMDGVRRLEALVDRFVDPTDAVVDRVISVAGGESGQLMADLHRVLRGLAGPLGVFAHDNPDPDAIASAIGLSRLAEELGVPTEACYFGEISHQENRAFVNLLDLPIRRLDEFDPDEYGGIALVDHSRPGVNDSLPSEVEVDLIVDHHPMREPVEAPFLDVRSDVGSTSALVTEYFERLGIEIGETLSTALLYGIRVDTRGFSREVSPTDFEAAASLVGDADATALERIESPGVSGETLETIARAIRDRDVRGSVVSSCVGELSNRDALSQAADRLANMNGVSVTFVYGFEDGTVYGSARARGADVDLGEVLRDAFAEVGSAGGHADMAGAQVPLGVLGAADTDDERLSEVVREVIGGRFFEAMESARRVPTLEFDTDASFPED